MTEDEKIEMIEAIRECIGDWAKAVAEDMVATIEPIIEKIEKRSRLEGATTTTQSLIG